MPSQLDDMTAVELAARVRRWHPRHRPRLVLLAGRSLAVRRSRVAQAFDAVVAIGSPKVVPRALRTLAERAAEHGHHDAGAGGEPGRGQGPL